MASEKSLLEICGENVGLGFTKLIDLEGEGVKNGLDLTSRTFQRVYDLFLSAGELSDSKKVEGHAKKKEAELKLDIKLLQEGYYRSLIGYSLDLNLLKEFEDYSKSKGSSLDFKSAGQRALQYYLSQGAFKQIAEIEKISLERKTNLSLSNQEMQGAFEEFLINGYVESLDEIKRVEDYLKDKRLQPLVGRDLLQKAYKRSLRLSWGRDKRIKLLKQYARQHKITLSKAEPQKIPEEESERDKIIPFSLNEKVNGIDVVFNVRESEKNRKFILARNGSNLSLVFNNSYSMHKDIGEEYSVRPIGGGYFDIDPNKRTLVVRSNSGDFGYEPRILTTDLVSRALPDFKLRIER